MLYVKFFEKQSIVCEREIRKIIERIPDGHLRHLDCIVYDPTFFFQRSYAVPKVINYRAWGHYSQQPKRYISIHKFGDCQEFEHVLFHEVGHHVFNNILGSANRVEWVTYIFPKSRHFVSNYARRNAQEDFSECYAYFLRGKASLIRDMSKLQFIRKNLM
ncbi:hypothetical protein BB427_14020 [Pseudoalteromonas sp. BMB]|uniref:hypothetical protein n=1 Tax=Pseudoalteromonas sp. BMB TaxID=1874619 RepID=UPI00083DD87D|nr:hypothetical protein [Pseudoalteromonas sp. BMB]ODB37109.1 hypothetical protein BB427_14020 [Pseudoalteromonas sp. BMB]